MVKVKIVSAFTKDGLGGNLAGVVIDSDLSNKVKQEIASKLGLSETVFITKISDSEYRFQYFTPLSEIDFCGHATVAGLSQLDFTEAKISTNSIEIRAINDGDIYFSVGKPSIVEKDLNEELILKSLCITNKDLDDRIPIKVVCSGVQDIFIPIANKDCLLNINPDFKMVKEISKEFDVVGYHLFSLDSDYTAVVRNFAPLYGIDEESATGSANSALGFYLSELKMVDKELVFLQGVNMNAESLIYVRVEDEVFLSGKTQLIEERLIEVDWSECL
ncbi:PhzF family phenazine biosynthesis protein [Mycoplasmatota bacterium zrk1]